MSRSNTTVPRSTSQGSTSSLSATTHPKEVRWESHSADSSSHEKPWQSRVAASSLNPGVGALQAVCVDGSQRIAVLAYSSCVKILRVLDPHLSDGPMAYRIHDSDTLDLKSVCKGQGGFTLSDVACHANSGKFAASGTNGNIFVLDTERMRSIESTESSSSLQSVGLTGNKMSSLSSSSALSSPDNRSTHRLKFDRSKAPIICCNDQDRAVNKICWAKDLEIVAAAAHDGVIKLFDCRTCLSGKPVAAYPSSQGRCMHSYDAKSNSARDVQFSPFNENLVASIYDSGYWCVWDNRAPAKPLCKVLGHTSNGFAISWHLSKDGVLATGSRDKTIKIWNINQPVQQSEEKHKPDLVIYTSNPVNRVAWRPGLGHEHQIASSCVDRGDISIWTAPYVTVPTCILRGHISSCMDFKWMNVNGFIGEPYLHDSVICVGKDGKVVIQHMTKGFFPRQHISKHVAAISSLGHVAIQRGQVAGSASAPAMLSRQTTPSKEFGVALKQGQGAVSVGLADISLSTLSAAEVIRSSRPGRAEGSVFDPAMLHLLAQAYWTGWEIDAISACLHNQSIALSAGLKCRAAVWTTALALLKTSAAIKVSPPTNSIISLNANMKALPFAAEVLGNVLVDLLEVGDCLHFVFLAEILRREGLLDIATDNKISPLRRREIYLALIEMLMRQRLFSVAGALIKVSADPYIAGMNSGGVTIHTACSNCSKEVPDNVRSPWCQRCRCSLSLCSLCQRPVRGLYIMCPVCAHGGHKACLEEWFKDSVDCPCGCEHKCCEVMALNTGNSASKS